MAKDIKTAVIDVVVKDANNFRSHTLIGSGSFNLDNLEEAKGVSNSNDDSKPVELAIKDKNGKVSGKLEIFGFYTRKTRTPKTGFK